MILLSYLVKVILSISFEVFSKKANFFLVFSGCGVAWQYWSCLWVALFHFHAWQLSHPSMQHRNKQDFLLLHSYSNNGTMISIGGGSDSGHGEQFEISYKNHLTGKVRRWNLTELPFPDLGLVKSYSQAECFPGFFGTILNWNVEQCENLLEYKKLFVCLSVFPVSPIVTNIRGWD